jgi:hypothetical protein
MYIVVATTSDDVEVEIPVNEPMDVIALFQHPLESLSAELTADLPRHCVD